MHLSTNCRRAAAISLPSSICIVWHLSGLRAIAAGAAQALQFEFILPKEQP
jgi:hypothetical protein